VRQVGYLQEYITALSIQMQLTFSIFL